LNTIIVFQRAINIGHRSFQTTRQIPTLFGLSIKVIAVISDAALKIRQIFLKTNCDVWTVAKGNLNN
jgi:hypothetical protein